MGAGLAGLAPWGGEGRINVVIETPRGSRNKYGFDEAICAMRLKHVLPEGMTFPYDFGFVPGTMAADGDPLDVLVLMDAPALPFCVLEARLVGVLEAEQRQRDAAGGWTRNDRLLAVADAARTQAHIRSPGDLRAGLLDEISSFFATYNGLMGRDFRERGRSGPDAARAAVQAAVAAAQG